MNTTLLMGILVTTSGFFLWLINTVHRASALILEVKQLRTDLEEVSLGLKNFNADFQQYFLTREIEDRKINKDLEHRLDKIERAMIRIAAKNQGTNPDLGN